MEIKDFEPGSLQAGQASEKYNQMLLPLNDALDILSGKWKLQIIFSLKLGRKRFKEIQKSIPGITPKMLSKALQELEVNELAKRLVYDTKPVKVEYELTDYGQSLKSVVSELYKWGAAHRKRITGKEGGSKD